MGSAVTKSEAQEWVPETKLEAKIKEAMQRRESKGTTMKSFNSIILKFPKIDEGLRNCKAIFQEFGELHAYIRCFLIIGLVSSWLFVQMRIQMGRLITRS